MREEAKSLPPLNECLIPNYQFIMNIIVWNCRGALKPSFLKHVSELVHSHNPTILVVMETQVGGGRAKQVIDRMPFDRAYHTETIEYVDGL